jgi:DNA-binding IclR family transcriptional regulator
VRWRGVRPGMRDMAFPLHPFTKKPIGAWSDSTPIHRFCQPRVAIRGKLRLRLARE